MRHQPLNKNVSVITGTTGEFIAVHQWIDAAQMLDPSLVIGADESNDAEICFVVVVPRSTQRERAQLFAAAKKVINQSEGKHHE